MLTFRRDSEMSFFLADMSEICRACRLLLFSLALTSYTSVLELANVIKTKDNKCFQTAPRI
jgi:hypothetical protein